MTIHDGFPDDADPRALEVLALIERARREGREVKPLLTVRAHSCGCKLGEVYRVDGVTVLTGTLVARVLIGIVDSRDDYQDRHHGYAVLLDDPDRPVQFGCKHGGTGTGEVGESLSRVRDAAAAAIRSGGTLRL